MYLVYYTKIIERFSRLSTYQNKIAQPGKSIFSLAEKNERTTGSFCLAS